MNLRPAGLADSELLFRLRNDPDTRLASRVSHEVTPEEHQAWLADVLIDPARTLFIAEHDGVAVGMGRLDGKGGPVWVSLAMAPEWQGDGLGRQLIVALCEAARLKGATRVLADVKGDNVRSLRAFLASGFIVQGMVGMEKTL